MYQAVLPQFMTSHYGTKSRLLHDVDAISLRRLYVDMQVRSGDYFATLATRIDDLSQEASSSNRVLGEELEIIVQELLHLQHNYIIDKK